MITHPSGLGYLGLLCRSVGRMLLFIRTSALVILAIALVFVAEFFFGQPGVGALVAAFAVAGLFEIWQRGGLRDALCLLRAGITSWAHQPPNHGR